MLSRIAVIALAVVFTMGVFGCSRGTSNQLQPESMLDNNWGRSFEAAKYNQTLNPDADKNLEPVEDLEGPAAERIMGDYVKGQSKKTQSGSGGSGVLSIQD